MKIEINFGGAGVAAISGLQTNFTEYIRAADNVISSFKAIKNDIYNIDGGADAFVGVLDDVDIRISKEEAKREKAVSIQKQTDDFLELAKQIDNKVASMVEKNIGAQYPNVTPAKTAKKSWIDEAWNWLCGFGEGVSDWVDDAVEWTGDAFSYIKEKAIDIWDKHWDDIVTIGLSIACSVVSIAIIASAVATGGASLLLVAGLSAASGFIVSGVGNVLSQVKDGANGETINWGEAAKEALISGVIGGVTGAIGYGLGGLFSNAFSKIGFISSLQKSASPLTRLITGFVLGGTTEVVTGFATRGAETSIETYLTTGEVDVKTVTDAMFDLKQMIIDFSIGGASEGFSAAKNAPDATSGTDVEIGSVAKEADESMELSSDVDIAAKVDSDVGTAAKQSTHTSKYKKTEYSGEITYTDPTTKKRITVETNRTIYQNSDIDPNFVIPEGTKYPNGHKVKAGMTNLDLMKNGQGPFVIVTYPDGKTVLSQIELHHLVGEETLRGSPYFSGTAKDGSLVEIASVKHDEYTKELHIKYDIENYSFRKDYNGGKSADSAKYNKFRDDYWKKRAEDFMKK